MERSIENMITGVHPYWKHSEDGTLMELPEKVVTIEHDGPFEKISVLDCTSQFEEKPTEAQLRNYVKKYLKNTSLTEPDIDIKIDFFQLWQTPGYQDIAEAERVSLCDTVHVYISKLGIEVSCKVTETEYDVLLERYKSITLPNAAVYSRNSSLSGSLGSLRDEAQLATEAVNRVETQVTEVFEKSEGHYGAERICGVIRKDGGHASFGVVKGIMERHKLISSHCRRRQRSLTDSRKARDDRYENLTDDVTIVRPFQVLSSDITYIRTGEGFDYLCQIRDGICIGDSLTSGTMNYNDNGTKYISYDKYSFPRCLERLTGISIENKGRGGNSSAEWYEAMKDVDLSGYDFCIMQLGVNDAIRYSGWTQTSIDGFSNIISKLKQENPHIKIFVANIIPATSYSAANHLAVSEGIKGYATSLNDPDVFFLDIQQYGNTKKSPA
jgi:hypothetical protein